MINAIIKNSFYYLLFNGDILIIDRVATSLPTLTFARHTSSSSLFTPSTTQPNGPLSHGETEFITRTMSPVAIFCLTACHLWG